MTVSSRTMGRVTAAAVIVVALVTLLAWPRPAAAVPPTPPDGTYRGSLFGLALARPVVGVAVTPSGDGYWLVASDGGMFAFGDAAFRGSTGAIALNQPIVGMASTPTGAGYWLVAADGGIFAFGDARFFGSTGGLRLNRPIVGMAATPSGAGYWLVASDGGIFAFGDAAFRGSTGAIPLNQPIVGMASTPNGSGYWLVAADGGIFAFNARFFGAMGGRCLPDRVVGLATSRRDEGYRMVGRDGLVYAFPGGASYALHAEDERCRPLRWNPCAPIPYVVNPAGGPPNALALVQAAVDQAVAATGLPLRFEGITDEIAAPGRPVVQARYGNRFAPILIGWADRSAIGNAAGLGGFSFAGPGSRVVSGVTPQIITGFAYVGRNLSGGDPFQTGVLLHEIGHALGLDHADDTVQVMNSVGDAGRAHAVYVDGDLAGFDRVGRKAGCIAPIPLR